MKRTTSIYATIGCTLVVLLTGCTDVTGISENKTVKQGYDSSQSGVQEGQDQVQRAQRFIKPRVEDLVDPLIPGRLRDKPGFDTAGVEQYLLDSQSARFAPVGDVGQATCPADPDLEEGMTVRCTLAVTGTPVPFDVTLTDVYSAAVKAKARLVGVAIPTAKLAKLVSDQGAEVTCDGGMVLVGKVGEPVTCTVAVGPQTQDITVTIKNRAGRVAIS